MLEMSVWTLRSLKFAPRGWRSGSAEYHSRKWLGELLWGPSRHVPFLVDRRVTSPTELEEGTFVTCVLIQRELPSSVEHVPAFTADIYYILNMYNLEKVLTL